MPAEYSRAFSRVARMHLRLMVLVLGIVALGATAHAQIPVVDLGNPWSGAIYPQDVSDTGIVVGYGYGTIENHTVAQSFMWSQATGTVTLPTVFIGTGPAALYALRVNDAGVVIGNLNTPDGRSHAFRWTQASGMGLLTPPGMEMSEVVAINNNGEIALNALGGDHVWRPFRWSPTGDYTEVPGPDGEPMQHGGWARDMNAAGVVVGGYVPAPESGLFRPFMWSPEGTIDLGGPTDVHVQAMKITSSSGVVIEAIEDDVSDQPADCSPSWFRALFWSASTGLLDMGVRDGSVNTSISDINRHGVAVGTSFHCELLEDGSYARVDFPIRWSADTGLQDNNFPASAINDDGYTIGNTQFGYGLLGTPDGETQFLDGLLPYSGTGTPSVLNNQGLIAGVGFDSEWNMRVVMWRYAPADDPDPPASNTPSGASVSVTTSVALPNGTAQGVNFTFEVVTTAGETTVTASNDGPAPPAGFKLTDPPVYYYDINTTASFFGAVRVCLGWSEGQVADEMTVSLFHYTNNQWVDITDAGSRDIFNNRICGLTTSFSPFTLFDRDKFPFVGFFDPIANGTVVNAAKAGSAIPVKFSLGGDRGLNIFAPGFPRAVLTQCDTGAPIDVIEETTNAGSSALTYDPATDRYTYVWKTEKAWALSCRQLQVKFTDGSVYTAKFTFSK
jgi:hypothetical protein